MNLQSNDAPPAGQAAGRGAAELPDRLFRLLVEGMRDYAIFMLSPEGNILSWNAGAQRIKGYAADEIVGTNFARFYPPEAVASGWPGEELRQAREQGRFVDEGWRIRKDGSRFWANVVITALYGPSGDLLGYSKITRDLTERRRVQRLEVEGRRINEFIAMLAHELRNPLAPIRNAVGIMEKTADSPELVWCKDMIGRQVDHLSRLVDDLLDVSRITRGKIKLETEPVDLAAVVGAAVESVRPAVVEYGHELQSCLPEGPVAAIGDPTRLTQVIVNLVMNAAKYTPHGGRVRVELEQRHDTARIRVVDNGIGMSAQLLEHAFDLFVQGDRTLDRSGGGLGIGLTLIKRIVALHGGAVCASSAGAGRGSEFVVTLPLAPYDAAPQTESHASCISVTARKILVVDDNVDAATSLSLLLSMEGHRLWVAHDGPDALRAASEQVPDVILLDVGLPGLDGYEVARRIRRLAHLSQTRLIAMTGYGQESDKRAAAEAGFDAYIVKPVDYEVLVETIERVVS